MTQVFVAELAAPGDVCQVDGHEHHYLTRSIRSRPGDFLTLADGQGAMARAVFLSADADQALLRVEERLPLDPPELIELLLCPPKGDALEDTLDQAAQLGIASVSLLRSERTLANFDGAALKAERLQRVLREACRQCNRGRVPSLRVGVGFAEALGWPGAGWLASERGGRPLKALATAPGPCRLLVGPEGGLSDAEHEAALRAGWTPVTLGPKLLRVPTAVAALISGIKTLWSPL